jgi:hypothetical protein
MLVLLHVLSSSTEAEAPPKSDLAESSANQANTAPAIAQVTKEQSN